MDLIDRKYLYEKIAKLEEQARKRLVKTPRNAEEFLIHKVQLNEISVLKHKIMGAPTVEAKEVVYGEWNNGCCSNCGAYIPSDSPWDYIGEEDCNFCYSCGADMRTSAE